MNSLQALYRLQLLESSLDEAKVQLAELENALLNDATVQEAKTVLEAHQQTQQQIHASLTNLDLEIAALNSKIKEAEQLIYSGTINNPRELQDHQDELESLKRRQGKLNEDLTTTREQFDTTTQQVNEAESGLKSIIKTRTQENQDLAANQKNLQLQMRQWLNERKGVLQAVAPEHYKVYKAIKSKKNGVAVARLSEEACSMCRVEQNQTVIYQVRQGKEMVRCQSCGRILIDF